MGLQAGMLKKVSGRKGHSTFELVYGGGVEFIKGTGQLGASINSGRLYTAPDGDSLFLALDMDIQSNSPRPQLTDIGGAGFGISPYISCKYGERTKLSLGINDFGKVFWTKRKSLDYHFEESGSYTGEEVKIVNNELNTGDYSGFLDSLRGRYNSSKDARAYSTWLPVQIFLQAQFSLKRGAVLTGLEYYGFSGHIPQFDLAYSYPVTKGINIQPGLSVGGYSNWGLSLLGSAKIKKNILIRAGTTHLEGLVPAKTHGQGLFFSLQVI
jgi:hypothetical protein